MAQQLTFDLPARPAQGRENFFVSPANEAALKQIDAWQSWPGNRLLLNGPEGAGKSHLARVWASMAGAEVIHARNLPQTAIPALLEENASIAVDDIGTIAGDAVAEQALFHLFNLCLAEGGHLLLTSRCAAPDFTLPDLKSRVEAAPIATIEAPDDDLLAAVLVKLMADRQLAISPQVISFLARRMERSFSQAERIVSQLDSLALSTHRPITRALAAEVLDNTTAQKA